MMAITALYRSQDLLDYERDGDRLRVGKSRKYNESRQTR